jgi:hypothetical protein
LGWAKLTGGLLKPKVSKRDGANKKLCCRPNEKIIRKKVVVDFTIYFYLRIKRKLDSKTRNCQTGGRANHGTLKLNPLRIFTASKDEMNNNKYRDLDE